MFFFSDFAKLWRCMIERCMYWLNNLNELLEEHLIL